MITILAQGNIVDNTWLFSHGEESPNDMLASGLFSGVQLQVGFIGDTSPVYFDGLSFSATILVDGVEVSTIALPYEGASPFVSSDQPVMRSLSAGVLPGSIVTCQVSATNGGESFGGEFTIDGTVPEPVAIPEPEPEA